MKRFIAGLAALLCIFMVPATASAANYNPFSSACSPATGSNSSSACSVNGKDPVTGVNGVLRKVTTIIAFIAGVAAVIVVVIGGFEYITSNGDPQKAASARKAIIGACIGIVIIVVAQSLVIFVLLKSK